MDIRMVCSSAIKTVIRELFLSKGFEIKENSNILFIEKEDVRSEFDGITVVFDANDLNSLLSFLERLKKSEKSLDNKNNLIAGKSEDKYELIDYKDVLFFEADNNHVYLKKKESNLNYRVKEKLYELEENLPDRMFIRVSKSYIVNILNISEIIPWFSGKLLLKFENTKREIEVSRRFVKNFKNFLGI